MDDARTMNASEPTQETTPVKGEPVEIPIPSLEEVVRDLEILAEPRHMPPPSE